MADVEEVVMTPLKSAPGTIIRVERFSESNLNRDQIQLFAGGPYKGIVISKKTNEHPETMMPEAHKEFNVDMLDPKAKEEENMVREKRLMRFWFNKASNVNKDGTADLFFKKVVDPDNFPRDSIHFVIRVLNLMRQFPDVKKMELEMRPLTSAEQTERTDYVITKQVTKVSRHIVTSSGPHGTIDNGYAGDDASADYGATLQRNKVRTAQDDAILLREEGLIDATYEEALEAVTTDKDQQWKGSLAATPHGAERIRKSQLSPDSPEKSKLLIQLAKKQRILTLIEDAYPNAVSLRDLVKMSGLNVEDVEDVTKELHSKGVISEMEKNRWVRIQASKKMTVVATEVTNEGETKTEKVKTHDVQVVAHIPQLPPAEQPTVAVITLLYTEKLAVDAMMDTKTTYVRYKTEGEGTVYTVGLIGKHKVVSTKLARIGRGQGAMVSAENTVTRLLGTFGKVENVILVGIGGGVANYSDDSKHVRLGDVVVSKGEFDGGPVYIRCNSVEEESGGAYSFNTQCWNPRENQLEKLAQTISDDWERHLEDAMLDLQRENARFKRPAAEKDKLIKMDDGNEVEVSHPDPAPGSHRDEKPTVPMVHYGCIGAGEELNKNSALRQDFSMLNDVKVVDCGFEGVLESIDGNRKDSFLIIRGVADYVDGTTRKEWQAYASLTAACVMKGILEVIPE